MRKEKLMKRIKAVLLHAIIICFLFAVNPNPNLSLKKTPEPYLKQAKHDSLVPFLVVQ